MDQALRRHFIKISHSTARDASNTVGGSRTAVNNGLANTDVSALAVSETNLFAGTDDGVFLSTNNGKNWTATGLTNRDVIAFAVNGTNLFAGTLGGGVWRFIYNGEWESKLDSEKRKE